MKHDRLQALLATMTVEERWEVLVVVARDKKRKAMAAIEGLSKEQAIYAKRLIDRGYTMGKACWIAKKKRE